MLHGGYIKGPESLCPSAPPKEYETVNNYAALYDMGTPNYKLANEPDRWGKNKGWNFSNIPLYLDSFDLTKNKQCWNGFGYSADGNIDCRHNKKANVCFLDGHVQAMSKSDFSVPPYTLFGPGADMWASTARFLPQYILEATNGR